MIAIPKFTAPDPTLPPHNTEAEESILGGIMLDPNALPRIVDYLPPEAFYHPSHATIYRAAIEVFEKNEIPDLINVTIHLDNHGLLEQIGNKSKLAALVDRTVSAVNIDLHAALILEHFQRRELLKTANDIGYLAYQKHIDLPEVLKEAEQRVVSITSWRQNWSKYRESQDEIELQQLTRDIEEIEQTDNLFQRKLRTKKLMKKWDIRSEKEFFDLHAKWLESINKRRSYSLDEYFQMHGNKSVEWLLDGWIPEKSITVIHSLGGTGKTTLINTIARSLITGTSWSGYEVTRPIRILWIQTDQGATVTTLLLDRQGFFALSPTDKERQRILDDWYIEEYSLLERELEEHKFDLVIIDSLASVSSQLIYRENDQEFARPIARLRHIANKHNTAFFILHHSAKGGEMRGTTAIYNSADQVWKLERVKDNPLNDAANLTIEKSRYREDRKTYRLQFNPDDHGWFSLGQVTGSGETEEIEDPINPKLDAIRQFLRKRQGMGFECSEIAEALGINQDYCRKLLNQGMRDGLINSHRGARRYPIYYLGQLHVSGDTTDPHRSYLRIGGEDRFLNQTQQAFEPLEQATDPTDPQNLCDVHQQIEKSEGSQGSVDRSGSVPTDKENVPSAAEQPEENLINVGDRVIDLADGRQGTVAKLESQKRGSPKKPFISQHAVVDWDDSTRTKVVIETLRPTADDSVQKGENDAPTAHQGSADPAADLPDSPRQPRTDDDGNSETDKSLSISGTEASALSGIGGESSQPSGQVVSRDSAVISVDQSINTQAPQKWEPRVGDRIITEHGQTGTIRSVEKYGFQVIYDNSRSKSPVPLERTFVRFEQLHPNQDPKVKAKKLFNQLKSGDKLKAKKHHDHKGFARRIGTVISKKTEGDTHLACCETDKGIEIFNLEAVEVIE